MIEAQFFQGDGLDVVRASLATLSASSSLIYLAFVSGQLSPVRAALKTFTIGVLAFLPVTYAGVPDAHVAGLLTLTLALVLSAIGDLMLALRNQERFFVLGLASFLLAHVAFLGAIIPYIETPSGGTIAVMIAVLVSAGMLLRSLLPRLGKMTVPVIGYFAVIMVMVAAALSVGDVFWLLGLGAVLFALSDSLIAVRKFLRPFPGINEAVWITYCVAQYMISAGLLTLAVPAQVT